jgi:signal transduction protein with GAF and PtsI domain
MSDELAELKRRYERLALLHEVNAAAHAPSGSAPALDVVLRAAVRATRADASLIALLNPTTGFLEIHASLGLTPAAMNRKWPVSEGILGLVTRSGKPARVADTRQDTRHVALREQARAELAVPLDVGGRASGALCVLVDAPGAFTTADEEWLVALAAEAAKVIHRAWTFEQLQVKAQLFETLASVSQTINSTLNLDDALKVITREACGLMQAKVCSLMLLDDTREWLDLRASHGAGPAYVNKPRLNAAESLIGVVVRRRKPLQIANVQTSGRYQHAEIARQEGLVALLGVPLVFAGQAVGALSVYKVEPYVFSNEEVGILSAFGE